jgi:hypothetical protein
MSLMALPIASRDAPGFSASYQRIACATAVATNGTMCGWLAVSISS